MFDSDLIKDILSRVQLELKPANNLTDTLAAKIELSVRQEWGGRGYYVNSNKIKIETRNHQIKRRYGSGHTTKERLAKEHGLTPRQIDRILK